MAESSSYRIERIASAYRIICGCGWKSRFAPSESGALGELERHRHKQHQHRSS